MQGHGSGTGVRIFEDHRDNLTVDVQSDLVRDRAAQMRSEYSEAALLWNVFRTLQRIEPTIWLPRLLHKALPKLELDDFHDVSYHWWHRYDVPETRHAWLRDAAQNACLHLEHHAIHHIPQKKSEVERRLAAELPFEEPVEIPVCIETDSWLLGLEAVYKGNLSRHTPYDSMRDRVLRLLDAGSWAASQSGKRFSLVVLCLDPQTQNAETGRLVERYRDQPERLVEALPHRADHQDLAETAGRIGVLRWKDLGSLLITAKKEERLGLFDIAAFDELIKFLARKDIGFNFFRRIK